MKNSLFVFLLLLSFVTQGQLSIATWNLNHFGAAKTQAEMTLIAASIKDFDVVALQEVNTRPDGARQLAQLTLLLDRLGADWDYLVSPPTQSNNKGEQERYAFVWKKNRIQLKGRGWLEPVYADSISREPFMADFVYQDRSFTLVNFHALPKGKQPEREIKWFKLFPALYSGRQLLFLGDFNCPQQHSVFTPLKSMGYQPALLHQKTTLRQACIKGDCLASAYDNIYFPPSFRKKDAGIVPFYLHYQGDQKAARRLSDHVPVFVVLE